MTPKKRMISDCSSYIKKRNGWLAMNSLWNSGRADRKPNRAVAAAASLPSSLTSMKDLCCALKFKFRFETISFFGDELIIYIYIDF